MQDLRSPGDRARLLSEDLEELMQRTLKPLQADEFSMNIYFGRSGEPAYDTLAWNLFGIFETPLLRARLRIARRRMAAEVDSRDRRERQCRNPITTFCSSGGGRLFLRQASPRRDGARNRATTSRSCTIPTEAEPPSDKKALRTFRRCGRRARLRRRVHHAATTSVASPSSTALFIRETTAVNHHTYRFARRAEAEGLVVIDDLELDPEVHEQGLSRGAADAAQDPVPENARSSTRDNIDDIVPSSACRAC